MTSNPFISQDRTHFPEFSPSVFSVVKTPSSEAGGFKWSIDNLARLKPAEIDTDLATLYGHSPDNGQEAQRAVEQFFSQKTILPSPWAHHISKVTPKKVTFSPLPPTLAYIQECSLSEQDTKDSGIADAGTQTVLTLPVSFNLEELLGPLFYNHDEDLNKDTVNCSLRRKLFGKPERIEQDSRSFCEEAQVDCTTTKSPSTPRDSQQACLTAAGGVSSTPWMSRFLSGEDQPSASSLVLQSPLMKSIADISPIRSNEGPKLGSVVAMATPSSTPFKGDPVPELAPLGLSPIGMGTIPPTMAPLGLSPIGVGTIPPHKGTNEVETARKVTSTPGMGTVTKRQLASSPFTSPLVKQPCVREPDGSGDLDGESGDEMAPPLSLADLQMDTYDLTDPSLPAMGGGGVPLHSTLAGGVQWWLAPVHSTAVESQHLATSSGPQTSCTDSGIATSSEFSSTCGTSTFSKGCVAQGLWCTQPSLLEEGQRTEVHCHGSEHQSKQQASKGWTQQQMDTRNGNKQLDTCAQHSFVAHPTVCGVPAAGIGLGTPPSNTLSHYSVTSFGYRNPDQSTPQGGLLPSRFRTIRTPSRYSDLRLGSTPTLKSCGMSAMAGDVLRKKEALKAKMRFDLSIQMNSSLCGTAVLSSPLSRVSGMGNRYAYTRPRGALVELFPNQFSIGPELKQHPQTPITSYWRKPTHKRELNTYTSDLANKENVPHTFYRY